jgi:hypothetical protein
VFSCHLLRFVLSFGELMSRGEKARRIFRQLERVVSLPVFVLGSVENFLFLLLRRK